MATVTVIHRGGDAFWIDTRGHVVTTDQPGADHHGAGPTPVELFVMSLASCVAYYAVRYLRHCRLPSDGLTVRCEWSMRSGPPRVSRIDLDVEPPAELDEASRAGLAAAVDGCTVQQTLRQPPAVTVHIAHAAVVAGREA